MRRRVLGNWGHSLRQPDGEVTLCLLGSLGIFYFQSIYLSAPSRAPVDPLHPYNPRPGLSRSHGLSAGISGACAGCVAPHLHAEDILPQTSRS